MDYEYLTDDVREAQLGALPAPKDDCISLAWYGPIGADGTTPSCIVEYIVL